MIILKKYYTIKETVAILRKKDIHIKSGDEVYYNDVYQGMKILKKQHPRIHWIDYQYRFPRISEWGIEWLEKVYFNSDDSFKNNDIYFFEKKIKDMILFCKENHIYYKLKDLICDDVTIKTFAHIVNKKERIVQKVFSELPSALNNKYYYYNSKKYIEKDAANEICRLYFQKRYVNHLEKNYCILKKLVGDYENETKTVKE